MSGFTPSVTKAWSDMALDRQPQAGHRGDARGVAGAGQRHLLGADEARAVSTPMTRPFSMRMPVTSQFWMMSTPR